MIGPNEEYVHHYFFEVGDDEFASEHTTIAATEEEAEQKIKNKLESLNMSGTPFFLQGVKHNVAKRRKAVAA